ncbi:unnamed protein product [Chrysoparadoxa australica]
MDLQERDAMGRMMLSVAAQAGDVGEVEELIGLGSELESRDLDQDTALIIASEFSHADCALALIRAGADLEARNKLGRSALHKACTGPDLTVVHLLLRHGAEVNTKDSFGYTPLLEAGRSRGGQDCAMALLEAGADVTNRGWNGNTALHYAACWCWMPVVRLLLQRGADPDVKDDDGKAPVDYCQGLWKQFPQFYTGCTEEAKEEVVTVLTQASLANARWEGRRLLVLLQANHDKGHNIVEHNEGVTISSDQVRLQKLVLWVVGLPDHEMQELFR